jgi:hexulose-6-phosphate isomerase
MNKIGFMQGRLCDQVNGKIQAFPWDHWQDEFPVARQLGVHLVEWTLDQEGLHENPLLSVAGQAQIRELMAKYELSIPSLTGDCFMQAPFYKAGGQEKENLLADLRAVLAACAAIGVEFVVVPLVDNGSLQTAEDEQQLLAGLLPLAGQLRATGVKIVFESDFPALQLASFIAQFPADVFGINYDIGNSAALGFSPAEEIAAYGDRILNVHVKDRILGGTTVPLGTGNADFPTAFDALKRCGYQGNFILQTARVQDGNHAAAIGRYRDMVNLWWASSES